MLNHLVFEDLSCILFVWKILHSVYGLLAQRTENTEQRDQDQRLALTGNF